MDRAFSLAAVRAAGAAWAAFALLGFAGTGHARSELTAVDLGRAIFFDTSLSASGQMACSTCHDPAHAHAPANGLAVQFGGPMLDVAGTRAAPSLRYLNTFAFSFDSEDTPNGGFNRDGRSASLLEQAERPLLSANEMANIDAETLVAKLRAATYADDFKAVFGDDVFDDIDGAFFRARFAIEAYEEAEPAFHPYSSKYDAFVAGDIMLSPSELRGLRLFNDPQKGNCLGCHPSARGGNGEPPVFTDYTYDNLGVPRNEEIPYNADAAYFDLGLCGPQRTDLAARTDLCGAFKVPTLRNVATRTAFFHNGRFHTLHDALRFYVRRDTNPEEFYPTDADGVVQKFDDLPPDYRRNVNTEEVPYDRHPGQAPRLDDAELDDLEAFLKTLTDGYDTASDTADPARDLVDAPRMLIKTNTIGVCPCPVRRW